MIKKFVGLENVLVLRMRLSDCWWWSLRIRLAMEGGEDEISVDTLKFTPLIFPVFSAIPRIVVNRRDKTNIEMSFLLPTYDILFRNFPPTPHSLPQLIVLLFKFSTPLKTLAQPAVRHSTAFVDQCHFLQWIFHFIFILF